jgi:uncharacterized RDD family membrane protein YckC
MTPPPSVGWETPSEPIGPAPGLQFGGFGERLVAYIIDSIILSIIFFGVFFVGIAGVAGAASFGSIAGRGSASWLW